MECETLIQLWWGGWFQNVKCIFWPPPAPLIETVLIGKALNVGKSFARSKRVWKLVKLHMFSCSCCLITSFNLRIAGIWKTRSLSILWALRYGGTHSGVLKTWKQTGKILPATPPLTLHLLQLQPNIGKCNLRLPRYLKPWNKHGNSTHLPHSVGSTSPRNTMQWSPSTSSCKLALKHAHWTTMNHPCSPACVFSGCSFGGTCAGVLKNEKTLTIPYLQHPNLHIRYWNMQLEVAKVQYLVPVQHHAMILFNVI